MTADDVIAFVQLLDQQNIEVFIDGGWGVDALLRGQTREHGDLDLAVEDRHREALVDSLQGNGFTRLGEVGATSWNFLLAHPDGAVVDLHVIVVDADGNGVLGPADAGSAYPAGSLTGRGELGGRTVDCVAAEWAVRFHDTYPGDATDRADVRALCDRFALEIPAQYQ
jgi:lincosamide nucleotidyltransferase A/C/D/E